MTINIRTKGQEGEREIARKLNAIVEIVREDEGWPPLEKDQLPFQRNQNQSAVGGDDLSNPFEISIEVKRQEQLAINTWWKQCLDSANKQNKYGILIFRQNRTAWRVMLSTSLSFAASKWIGPVRVEIDMHTFEQWFKEYYRNWLKDKG